MNIPPLLAGAVAGISILGTVVTVTTVFVQMRATIKQLETRDGKHETKEEEIDRQVVELLGMFKQFIGAQTELNVTVKGFMQAQTTINERFLGQMSQANKAMVEGSQVISLLTEVLKQKKVLTSDG